MENSYAQDDCGSLSNLKEPAKGFSFFFTMPAAMTAMKSLKKAKKAALERQHIEEHGEEQSEDSEDAEASGERRGAHARLGGQCPVRRGRLCAAALAGCAGRGGKRAWEVEGSAGRAASRRRGCSRAPTPTRCAWCRSQKDFFDAINNDDDW